MSTVLMIAEKPSLAESLARILSGGRSRARKGVSSACPVHEFRGRFMREPDAFFKFTSVCGHLTSVDFPPKFNNWDRIDPLEVFHFFSKFSLSIKLVLKVSTFSFPKLFDAEIVKKEATPNLRLFKHLQIEAKNSHYLVLWLDCDKEGENICFEILDAIASVFPISFDRHRQVGSELFAFRFCSFLRFSSDCHVYLIRQYFEPSSVQLLSEKLRKQ